jgi:hypothetical protein
MQNFLGRTTAGSSRSCDLKAPVRAATEEVVDDRYKNNDCVTYGLPRADRSHGY